MDRKLSFIAAIFALTWNPDTAGGQLPSPVVTTPEGSYIGSVSTSVFNGKTFVTYRSIPFAQPPVGPLRFQRPQLPAAPSGSQYLNTETFKPRSCATPKIYPVMVWIHGGGFVAGNTFPEPVKMVTRGDVIVVTVNYRMGAFGFLTTLDGDLPANNGLWDVEMALQWVQDNIRYFSGNDSSVTVFGESAGAVSVTILAVSPISGQYFHKAILQSGALTSTIYSRDAPRRAREFAALAGCSAKPSSSQLADCLRGVSIAAILNSSKPSSFDITVGRRQADFIWEPTVDGEFLPREPLDALSNITDLKHVGALDKDYIVGVLNNEGGLFSENFLSTLPLSTVGSPPFPSDILDFLIFNRYGVQNNRNVQNAVFDFYNVSVNEFSTPQSVLDFSGDVYFNVPAVEMALALSECLVAQAPGCCGAKPKVFFYQFDYCPPVTNLNKPQCLIHGADVLYEFPRAILTDPVQNQLSDTFIDLLTTFARSSTPGTAVESGWPLFTPASQQYLRLDTTSSVRLRPYDYRVIFWLTSVPSQLVRP
ncbi:hypothetical protein Btru_056705 [Bulinus truncatus]|nr:hypothetical protein Btru_056705 [Bulinus truncatus]